MSHTVTAQTRASGFRPVALLMAVPVVVVILAGVAAAEDTGQPQVDDGSYSVPVPAWVADAALDLKREFVMGVARQAVSMAEESATEEVRLLVEAAEDIADAGGSVESTVSTIGSIDS